MRDPYGRDLKSLYQFQSKKLKIISYENINLSLFEKVSTRGTSKNVPQRLDIHLVYEVAIFYRFFVGSIRKVIIFVLMIFSNCSDIHINKMVVKMF